MPAHTGVRVVRIPEEVFLSRPELWTRDGLDAYLEEQGFDLTHPSRREDTFVRIEQAQDRVESSRMGA